MNVRTMVVASGVAGLLILQLAVIAPGQQSAPAARTFWSSAPSAATLATENSQTQDASRAVDSALGSITQSGKAGGSGDPALGGERHPLYRLSKSDTVEVNFTFSPDLNQNLTIQPDGFMALRGAGTLFAEGLTVPELQQAITAAYRGILHEPEVTVTLKDFEKPYFLASGEVARPGKYELRGDLTVNEAIAMAGGFTQRARHSQVILFRRLSTDIAEAHLIDIKKMLNSRDLREDLHLRAGDFVFVPQSRTSKIRRYVPASTLNWYMNPLQF
jgi:polysaccharide export outer membrane protein